MKYSNPVIKGFYPDPSVCEAEGKYYLVASSFQYFPGVPLFESEDLVNWRQIGHVLTRKSQVMLDKIASSGGVFAPTIRYNNGRFYMVTTNDTTHENFYVYTDDIYGEWSEPITVEQNGIDPSLLFDGDHVYFMSNGSDDNGEGGVVQCEIDIATGKKLSASRCIWKGSGGRYLESPHMYHIGSTYYLMAAEGGTEYGHMITYAKSDSVWGPFENYPENPVLTNRNKAPYIIQGVGHGDLIQDKYGDWHVICLGFRQIHMWRAYHILGREVFMAPVTFREDGWFTAGTDGTMETEYEIRGDFAQLSKETCTFENTEWNIDWCYMRHPDLKNYELEKSRAVLRGTDVTLDQVDSPTFLGIRQREFHMNLAATVSIDKGEAGVTVYSCENEHYDLAVRKCPEKEKYEAVLRLNIGGIKHVQSAVTLPADKAELFIRCDGGSYFFEVKPVTDEGTAEKIYLGSAQTKYVSKEVSEGFTGVLLGLYAVGNNTAEFTGFGMTTKKESKGEGKMEFRTLDKLGIKTSLLGFGCMRFPTTAKGKIDEERAQKMLDEAYAAGINYYDTAWPYHGGESEPFVGRAMKKYPRDSFYFATKLPCWDVKVREDATRIFNQQLEHLQSDYVDFYLLHALNRDRFREMCDMGVLDDLIEFKNQGKIKYLGFSFHDGYEAFEEILTYRDWDFCQIQYNYMDTNEQAGDKGYALCEKLNVPIVIMEPIKGGALASYAPEVEDMFKAVRPEKSVASWALRWVASKPQVKVVLSGMSTEEQVKDNLETFGNFETLSEKELETVENVIKEVKSRIKNGCTACRYCMPCPFGVNIPGNFAIWNNYGMYNNAGAAKWRYFHEMKEEERADKCMSCGACEEACPQKLPIREHLAQIAELMNHL